ncbi:hypothetical protein LTR28_008368 [Elasticomyces elasticus]|nr:hypothetical protein LTR28_008368 [Elasticomyces elasticus]
MLPAVVPTRTAKKTKRVRITSPPHSPPDLPRRLSVDGHSDSSFPSVYSSGPKAEEPDQVRRRRASSGNSTEDEEIVGNTGKNSGFMTSAAASQGVWPNPFARTLSTMESVYAETREDALLVAEGRSAEQAGTRPGPGKGGLDVDSFTRLLMTGKASPAVQTTPPFASPAPPPKVHDSSSSTDTSSISRQSLFELVHDLPPESPRSSFEHSPSEDDEHSSLVGEPKKAKPKPPPPTHRHGKAVGPRAPQTVSFADFTPSFLSSPRSHVGPRPQTPPLQGISSPASPRTPTDLNKPLPAPPPASTSPETVPPVPEKDATPAPSIEPLSDVPGIANQKRAPPPPPSARRQIRAPAGKTRARSSSSLTQSSVAEEPYETPELPAQFEAALSKTRPPPPPARRPYTSSAQAEPPVSSAPPISSMPVSSTIGSERSNVFDVPVLSSSSSALHSPLPPARTSSSDSITLAHSPSSSSIPPTRPHRPSPTSANPSLPPLPPPRRSGSLRTSHDRSRPFSTTSPSDSRRTSTETKRASVEIRRLSAQSQDGARRTSASSLQRVAENAGDDDAATAAAAAVGVAAPAQANDILADMEKLQSEVDALRARYRGAS